MRTYKSEINKLLNLLESKDHLIDKLDLDDEKKQQLKDFFKKYPNYESKIDWNKKDLKWEDFTELLNNEGKSKSQAKKKGIEGITEGVDYKILEQTDSYIAYQPLTYLGSMTIASNRVPPVKDNGAQWCTAYQKTDMYWRNYTRHGCKFCYVCDFEKETKFALVLKKNLTSTQCFSFNDIQMRCPQEYKHLYLKLRTPAEQFIVDQRAEAAAQKKLQQQALVATLPERWAKEGYAYVPKDEITQLSLIKEAIIPDGVKIIPVEAFRGCTNLKKVVIPASVKSIGGMAFAFTKIKQIVLPEGLTSIDTGAFMECKELEEVVIPESVTLIENCAFYGCKALKKVKLPSHLTMLGHSAFRYAGLEEIEFPESLTEIPHTTFCSCVDLKTIKFPSALKNIGDYAFSYCYALETVTIPESVTKIGERAFWDCRRLKFVDIQGKIKELAPGTFNQCDELQQVNLPSSIEVLGSYCFDGDKKLERIEYDGTKKQWEQIIIANKTFYCWGIKPNSNYLNPEIIYKQEKGPFKKGFLNDFKRGLASERM